MRNFDMINAARKMNDLYDELVEVHKWNPERALQMAMAFFTEGYTK